MKVRPLACWGNISVPLYCWALSMGIIHEQYPWALSMGIIHGHYPWVLSMGIIHGRYPWALSVGNIHGQYPWALSMGNIHGHYPWALPMGNIHGHYPWVPYVLPPALPGGHNHTPPLLMYTPLGLQPQVQNCMHYSARYSICRVGQNCFKFIHCVWPYL